MNKFLGLIEKAWIILWVTGLQMLGATVTVFVVTNLFKQIVGVLK